MFEMWQNVWRLYMNIVFYHSHVAYPPGIFTSSDVMPYSSDWYSRTFYSFSLFIFYKPFDPSVSLVSDNIKKSMFSSFCFVFVNF